MTEDLAFVDIETTGLDAEEHEIWEICVIRNSQAHVWRPEPQHLESASEKALEVGGFRSRTADEAWNWEEPEKVAKHVHQILDGAHVVGMNPAFDTAFLRQMFRRHGLDPVEPWHYHLIDCEALMLGWLMAGAYPVRYPYSSAALSRAVGVEPPDRKQIHTAENDARWALAVYERLRFGS